ncbi:hypothetical protein DFO67_13318 [Modicisalibacter xianhensis]|uniref:CopG family transcriptional regulator n=1 Tax=Modicisalibacter xianhensis TaxID=442341 RepID=A0A4R8FI59_9GAMM|nr:DUF411 domain-containing protein [Halomonas xianhensis]TDX21861.1 hypothetical protein DFO67_13318 [Halomonas xianhensis]
MPNLLTRAILPVLLLASASVNAATGDAIMFKNPNCGCCAKYAEYLRQHGLNVKVVPTDQMDSIKAKAGIPRDEASCHTLAIGGYAVEGHVPVEAIERLLREKPAIQGITLAGMPSGSPGMPGSKQSLFVVKAFVDGQTSVFSEM